MYWFRTENHLIFLVWLAVATTWTLGGWLMTTHAFRLESRERLILGFGLGLVIYLWILNVIGRWLVPTVSFILAAFVVLAVGLIFAWKGKRPILNKEDLYVWRWILVGLLLVWLFERLARGLAIFDEPKNLSIVSTMAAGDIPPHHYMNAVNYFPYHYGFQLLGASLMRLGGLLPWSAFDLSKAITGAYLFLLIALFTYRYLHHRLASFLVAFGLAFSTGIRYMLYLVPARLMAQIDTAIRVRAPDEVVGMPLSQAIVQGLVLEDGPPAPFIYGYMNGFGWPMAMNIHIGPSTLSFIILLLVWMLAPRMNGKAAIILLAILFSHWALVWESSYGVFLVAGLMAAFTYWVINRRYRNQPWIAWTAIALIISIPFALFQGGTVTEVVRKIITGFFGSETLLPAGSASVGGFSLRWPPAIFDKHLGSLEIFSPIDLFVAFLELGPVILFTPWISWWAWKKYRQGDWMLGVVVASAWIAFIFPIVFSYEYDRDIVRFTEHALWVWTLVLIIIVFDQWNTERKKLGFAAVAGLALMMFGGFSIVGTELSAGSRTVLTEGGVTDLDGLISRDVWDRLLPGSEVFDSFSWRATMLTGRLTRVVEGNMSYNYSRSPVWQALVANPTIEGFKANGFEYVYVDEKRWNELSPASQESLSSPCVKIIAERMNNKTGEFRRLLSFEECNP